MTGQERVTVAVTDGVADVRLNRPDKHNALDEAQFRAIKETGMHLMQRTDVRVVVLSGNGPSFCSGIDYPSFMAQGPDAIQSAFEHDGVEPANSAQTCAWVWKRIPVPVILALRGVAFGGGCQIALGADIRIAHPDARMSVMEIEYGLIPDMGCSQTLRELVRQDVAKELTYTGRIVGAQEALTLGLVTRLADDPLAEALAMAQAIAKRSPDAIRGIKRLFEESWHTSPGAGLQLEESIQKTIIGQPNQVEAVMARLQKREAAFKDPAG